MGRLKIGIFDSGIGGFSILNEILVGQTQLEFYYFADSYYAPYGNKTKAEIVIRSKIIVEGLLKKGCEFIIVACNTATAYAINELREQFGNIFVGVEPYLNAINHLSFNENDKIGVLTTVGTSDSKRFKDLKKVIDPDLSIFYYTSKNLASLIESRYYDSSLVSFELFEDELDILKTGNLTHLILGCTHYPLISRFISNYLHLTTISPCPFVAKQLRSLVHKSSYSCDEKNKSPSTFFYFSTEINSSSWEQFSIDKFFQDIKRLDEILS